MIVADTNLISYVFLPGSHNQAAHMVFHVDSHWHAPLLWRSEFRNVLSTQVRAGMMDLTQAQRAMREARLMMKGREIEVNDDDVLAEAASARHPAYDCEFVVLARALGVPLVTADSKLLRLFPGIACSPEEFIAAS